MITKNFYTAEELIDGNRSQHQAYHLEDRYTHDNGSVFLSGIQALSRLPIEQLRVDRQHGLNTAAFASGYQGSPLAGLGEELMRASATVPDLPIHCQPAVNEELAATAVMGSQLASTRPDARYDGVVGLWYGKAPGLDRACDALRHAVFVGTSPMGGAVAIVGDDPSAKSSSLPSSSDATFVDLHMPILYPADVQEALDLGRHAIALSRASGLWVGLKIEASVADGTATIDLNPQRISPVMPLIDGKRYECVPDAMMLAPRSLEVEHELRGIRSELAIRYAAENQLNRITIDAQNPWICLIATGCTYRETLEALRRLGLSTPFAIASAGIRIVKMSMPVPFDPRTIRRFANGLEELFVIEEMNPTLERMVREALYHEHDRPIITGKQDPEGRPLIPNDGLLDADRIVHALWQRLEKRLGTLLKPPVLKEPPSPLSVIRSPYYCSGCPHNRSTRVPDGSTVGIGIGCHTMAMLTHDDRVGDMIGLSAMGNEGAAWIGMSNFVETDHLFQNLGDGTFFHSGQLAIQAAVASAVNITYKLLFNGTVAMTGGQDPVGGLGIPQVVQLLRAYGVAEILITTDDPGKYSRSHLPSDVLVWDRRRLIEAQERLARVPGVTVLIHDQPCAAELRRKRKRGILPAPVMRVAINHRICEGCGDCGRVSSCLSVEPFDTPFGRKTRINQQSCNFDYSCLEGDCPAFMSVVPTRESWWGRVFSQRDRTSSIRKPPLAPIDTVPDPVSKVTEDSWSIRMVGIGGTGVLTAAQIIGTAATLGGHHVSGLDQTGLSQKAGSVISDLRMTHGSHPPPSNHLGSEQADALIVFDQLAAASPKSMEALAQDRTYVAGSTSSSITASMVGNADLEPPSTQVLTERIEHRAQGSGLWMDATRLVKALTQSAAGANIFVVGAAVQNGIVPVSPNHVEEAIGLNGVSVEANISAFRWGRCYAAHSQIVEAAAARPASSNVNPLPRKLEDALLEVCQTLSDAEIKNTLRLFASELVEYQNVAYALAYVRDLKRVAEAEASAAPGSSRLTLAAARNLYQLLAYKDEYEVARLMLDEESFDAALDTIDGPSKASWQLHPPLLRAMGLKHKISVPNWMSPLVRLLAKGKFLRGTVADLFGYAEVRRVERAMIVEYRSVLETIVTNLSTDNLKQAVQIAALPSQVRGYEEIKLRRAAEYRAALQDGLNRYENL